MTKQVKTKIKHSLLAALLAASGSFFAFVSVSTVSSQAHSLSAGVIDKSAFYDAAGLQAFYQNRDMRPVWVRGQGSFQPRAEGVLKILEDSWTHGLNPEKYHVIELRQMISQRSEAQTVDLDMLLTDAIVRYARDLTGMRNKNYVQAHQVNYWRQPMPASDIIAHVTGSADPVSALRKLEPTGNLYNALRLELITLAKQDSIAHDPIKISKSIKPGKLDKAIPMIRQRFGMDYSGSTPDTYDDELASRIMTLQRHYGLEDDGVITAALVDILNKTNHDKIIQIIANMERLRWLDQDKPDRYILVNIPSASLWAVEGGEVALEMPVIVGKTARPTYSFKTEITGVRLNPNWTVPPTIKKADFLPMLKNDPYVLSKRGIELVQNGRSIDPGKVDWNNLSSKSLHNIRMVQGPGDTNPLGKVRVIMENPYNIYLHDTNHREMFVKRERALSSGCIRVSEPEKLADFILKNNEDLGWTKMMSMIDSGRMRDISTQEKIPVYITYQTIWLDSEGRLIYGRDVYGQDKKLGEMLENSSSIHIPNPSKNTQISL